MKPASISAKITVLLTSAASDNVQASEDSSQSDTKGMQRVQEGRIFIELPERLDREPQLQAHHERIHHIMGQ